MAGRKSLVEIPLDVIQILNADGEPDHIGFDAGGRLLFGAQLLMGGRSRMDDQATGVADVGQVREELEAVDKLAAGIVTALDAKAEHGAGALGQVLLGQCVIGTGLEARVLHPFDEAVPFEEFGDGLCVGHVAIHARAESFDALNEEERVEGAEAWAEVA